MIGSIINGIDESIVVGGRNLRSFNTKRLETLANIRFRVVADGVVFQEALVQLIRKLRRELRLLAIAFEEPLRRKHEHHFAILRGWRIRPSGNRLPEALVERLAHVRHIDAAHAFAKHFLGALIHQRR